MDSTYWNDFAFRDDDIIIGTWQKAGTTWVQQIVAQFIFEGETEGLPIGDMSPWLDFRLPPLPEKLPAVEAQEHRRFLKTHLPLDAMVFDPKVKFIYIARDGAPFWPFWENIRTWWEAHDLPNVYFLHFQNLVDDMEGQMRKIGEFLEIPVIEDKWEQMVHHCTFDYMKNNATLSTPLGGILFEGGAKSFVNKGTNDRWRDTLTADDIAAYEARAIAEVGEECAHWLETGKFL